MYPPWLLLHLPQCKTLLPLSVCSTSKQHVPEIMTVAWKRFLGFRDMLDKIFPFWKINYIIVKKGHDEFSLILL